MTTAITNGDPGASTSGYLFCRNRVNGCEWSVVFRTFAEEPQATLFRELHETSCAYQMRPER